MLKPTENYDANNLFIEFENPKMIECFFTS